MSHMLTLYQVTGAHVDGKAAESDADPQQEEKRPVSHKHQCVQHMFLDTSCLWLLIEIRLTKWRLLGLESSEGCQLFVVLTKEH